MNGHSKDCERTTRCKCEMARYWLVAKITAGVALTQLVGGMLAAESLSNLADAGHGVTDSVAALVSLVVAWCIYAGKDEKLIRRVGAIVNLVILAFTASAVWREATERFENPGSEHGLDAKWMTALALVGVIGNLAQHLVLRKVASEDHHETHRILSAHVLADLLISVMASIGGVLILRGANPIVDAEIALLAAGAIFVWAATIAARLILNRPADHSTGHH